MIFTSHRCVCLVLAFDFISAPLSWESIADFFIIIKYGSDHFFEHAWFMTIFFFEKGQKQDQQSTRREIFEPQLQPSGRQEYFLKHKMISLISGQNLDAQNLDEVIAQNENRNRKHSDVYDMVH